MNEWVVGDCLEVLRSFVETPNIRFDLVIGDPPYDEIETIRQFTGLGKLVGKSLVCFSYLESLPSFHQSPDQVCIWAKPVSTKNTSKKYSRFCEAISIWHGPFFNQDLHWSTRTGLFNDSLVAQGPHPFKKPESLIEKLVRLHCPPGGTVLDCFGGSGTVHDVCSRIGMKSVSIEIDPKWSKT